jgi:hypothetical protein
MATQYDGNGTFKANVAISAYRGVTLNSSREAVASATAVRPDSITQRDAATGDYVAVKFFNGPGTQKISITGCPVTAADLIYAGASGQATRAGGTVVIGRAEESASTNGSIIAFTPMSVVPTT